MIEKQDILKMNELELQKFEAIHPKTIEELVSHIKKLLIRSHDYGTCVYAVSLASVATFNLMAFQLGITGFQASCADLDFLRRTRNMENGFQILNFDDLFYPQYKKRFDEITWEKLIQKNIKHLKKRAKKLLKEHKNTKTLASENVLRHWKWLAKGGNHD